MRRPHGTKDHADSRPKRKADEGEGCSRKREGGGAGEDLAKGAPRRLGPREEGDEEPQKQRRAADQEQQGDPAGHEPDQPAQGSALDRGMAQERGGQQGAPSKACCDHQPRSDPEARAEHISSRRDECREHPDKEPPQYGSGGEEGADE